MPVEILIVILVVILVVAVLVLITLPKLLYVKENARNAYRDINDILKGRWVLIPKFIEVLKPYFSGEKSSLEEIILIRNTTFENMTFEKRIETDKKLSDRLIEIDKKMHNYADLDADEKYNKLLKEFQSLGDELSKAKKEYDGYIDKLNKLTSRFPTNMIALVAGFKKIDKLD